MKKTILIILFFQQLFLSCDKGTSKVQMKNKTYNFGTLSYGDTLKHKFSIKNISNVAYLINDVSTSCGCTNTEYTTSAISKGEFAKVEIEYTPLIEDQGKKISKSVVLSDNSENGFQVLRITGVINREMNEKID